MAKDIKGRIDTEGVKWEQALKFAMEVFNKYDMNESTTKQLPEYLRIVEDEIRTLKAENDKLKLIEEVAMEKLPRKELINIIRLK